MSNNSDSQIISVRIHLGDMGKEILHLEDDSERSDWLLGFHAGTLGRAPRSGWSHAKECGFHFGASALAEACEFRSKKARGGKVSAEKRREKYGSSQPSNTRADIEQATEQPPNSVRAAEQCSSGVREIPEQTPEQQTNQPTAYRQQPIASELQPLSQKTQQPTTSDFLGLTVPPREREAAPGWSPETRAERLSARRQKWLEDHGVPVDFTVRPGILTFLSYCKAVHPSWQEKHAKAAFEEWAFYGWSIKGRKIESWWRVADAWAGNADHSEHGERFPMGQIASRFGVGDSMSAKAAGITTGEPI